MNKKALIIGGSAIAVVAVVVALILIFTGSSDAYRSIKVFEIDGSCKVERGGDSLDAFKNMALSSGDSLTVGDGSFARLKLDDDKYVYLEANTKINLTATGTANDSKTMVYIERGSMLTEVKKKLSATSSYDIVTPNTTMSIRGTKTLTEVYEDVLGAIKTSAAVVEGQVKFSTIQKDKTGKAVIVSTDLTVGQGYGVTTESKDLLSEDDVKHIADDGKTVDGQTAEETTHEELGTTLENPAFSDEFLTNIVAVLARSREEDIEEGFAAEDVTEEELNAAINVLNDVIDGKVELPAAVEEYIVSRVQPDYDEPIYNILVSGENNDTTPAQPQVESEPEQIADDTVIPEDTEGEGDDTFVVDGTGETLVGIADDTDDEGVAAADDRTDDAQDDDTDEVVDAENDESDEADDDGSDEGDASDEDAEDGEEESDDKSDEDGEEDAGDESDGDEASDEESEEQEEQPEQTTDQPSSTSDAQEPESSAVTDPNATDERVPSGGGTSDPNSGTDQSVNLSYGSTTAYVPSSTNTSTPVTLSFYEERTPAGSSHPERYTIEQGNLPTSLTVGAPLPGTQGSDIHVEFYDTEMAKRYEFAGWYKTERGAMGLTSSDRVETAQSGNLTLYPGVREKKFTVTITNLFTRAGQVYIPDSYTNGVAGTNGITYTYDTNGGGNRIVISGIPYGYELPLPISLDNYIDSSLDMDISEIASSRLYVKGHDLFEEMCIPEGNWEEMVAPVYLGVGSSDNLSVSEIDERYYDGTDDEYKENIVGTGRFIPGASYYNYENRYFDGIKKEITGDCNLYMYFAIPVSLTVNVGQENLSKTQFTYSNGTTQSLGDIIGRDIQNGSQVSFDDFVVLGDGSKWKVKVESGIIIAKTDYYGKRLDIPRVSLTEMPSQKDFSKMLYTVKQHGWVGNDLYPTIRGTTCQDRTILLGDAVDSTDPLPELVDGKVWYSKLKYDVVLTEYAVLDVSGSGVESLYEKSAGVVRDSTLETQNKIKLTIEKDNSLIWINLPSDPSDANEYGSLWDNYPFTYYNSDYGFQKCFDTTAWGDDYIPDWYDASVYIRKSGYKIIGYKLSYTPKPTSDAPNPQPVEDSIMYGSDKEVSGIRLNSEYNRLQCSGTELPVNDLVITPIFVPKQPFTTSVMRRDKGKQRSTSTNPDSDKWALYDYITVLEGPGLIPDESGYPFVNEIIDSTFGAVKSSGEVETLNLIPILRWNWAEQVYERLVYDPNLQSYTTDGSYTASNGRIEIPWIDLYNDDDFEEYFYRGVKLYEYTNQSGTLNGVYFRTRVFGDNCIMRVTEGSVTLSSGEEEWQIFPCDMPEDSDSLFTAVWSTDREMINAVFSEESDSFNTAGDFLKIVSGESDLNRVWFGGKLYPLDDNYDTDLSPVLITRETTGLAKNIIHGLGSEHSGSGELLFAPVNSISVKHKDSAIMYPYGDYEFVNGSIQRKSGVDLDTYMSLSDDPEHLYHLSQEKSSESTLPDGWIVVDYKLLQDYYYIYIGDDEDVTGKAEVEFMTEWDQY